MTAVEMADPGMYLGVWLDEDLVREEFESIIAAEYPASRPPRTRSPKWCGPQARSLCRRPLSVRLRTTRAEPFGSSEDPFRGRSPPTAPRECPVAQQDGGMESADALNVL